jgi:hypothetical protein
LIGHGAWALHDNCTVHFIKHDEGVGFKSHHGARNGWLMFIGIPMDFRNT